jgi:hypothetical protein
LIKQYALQPEQDTCNDQDDAHALLQQQETEPAAKRRKLAATNSRLNVDSECGYAGRVVLTEDGCDAYSVMLNQYSAASKFNKYYLMQLLKVPPVGLCVMYLDPSVRAAPVARPE